MLLRQDFSNKCDVFSFAIVLWEMLTFKTPLVGTANQTIRSQDQALELVVNQGLRPPRPRCTSAPAVEQALFGLLEDCWHSEAARRPAFTQICARLTEIQDNVNTGAFPFNL
jgi:hypothetical protein